MDIGIFKKLHAAQLKCRVKLFALILSYLEVATHYLPLYQILLFQQILTYPICPLHVVSIQRPGGGWSHICSKWRESGHFNTQPPEGGWQDPAKQERLRQVSTHSRPKAAGIVLFGIITVFLCFNTQPPEGGWLGYLYGHYAVVVSTHSRPKAAEFVICTCIIVTRFQHTAARRRLERRQNLYRPCHPVSTHSRPKAAGIGKMAKQAMAIVSTHSRPKAAGRPEDVDNIHIIGFNTQPPEGGWRIHDTV